MLARLIDAYLGPRLRRPHFPGQRGAAARRTTRQVVGVFADGARASLRRQPRPAVVQLAAAVPWYRRSYFWEGYALGLAAIQAWRWPRRHPNARRVTSRYSGMHFLGYGFWNGLAMRRPVPEIPLDRTRWVDVAEYDTLSPLLAGGAAFAVTESLESLNRALPWLEGYLRRDASWAEATLHGCGRALWFVYMDNEAAIETVLHSHPGLARGLAEGVGIAVAYTRLPDLEEIRRTLQRFSITSIAPAPLLCGVGACLAALVAEDPANEARVLALEDRGLATVREVWHQAARQSAHGPGWYAEVTQRVRNWS